MTRNTMNAFWLICQNLFRRWVHCHAVVVKILRINTDLDQLNEACSLRFVNIKTLLIILCLSSKFAHIYEDLRRTKNNIQSTDLIRFRKKSLLMMPQQEKDINVIQQQDKPKAVVCQKSKSGKKPNLKLFLRGISTLGPENFSQTEKGLISSSAFKFMLMLSLFHCRK